MPVYLIEQFERHIRTKTVEADSLADAINSVLSDNPEVKTSYLSEYDSLDHEVGLSYEQIDESTLKELKQKEEASVYLSDGYLETIKSAKEV